MSWQLEHGTWWHFLVYIITYCGFLRLILFYKTVLSQIHLDRPLSELPQVIYKPQMKLKA